MRARRGRVVLAAVTGDRLPQAPDAPTVGEIVADLTLSLWNGLFVPNGTPQATIDRIAEVAQATIASERAQTFAAETGAQIYWQDTAAASAQIGSDIATMARIAEITGQ